MQIQNSPLLTLSSQSDYSPLISANLHVPTLCRNLKTDLDKQVEVVFQKIITQNNSSSFFNQLFVQKNLENIAVYVKSYLMQFVNQSSTPIEFTSTHNSLQTSLKEIELNGEKFFKDEGQCKGMCEWLIALYLHLKKKYPEISSSLLLKTLVSTFSEGASIQAAFLQKIGTTEIHNIAMQALQMKIEEVVVITFSREAEQIQSIGNKKNIAIQLEDIEFSNEKIEKTLTQEISQLPNGVYKLGFHGVRWPIELIGRVDEEEKQTEAGHATMLLVEQNDVYFFDPNLGLIGALKKERDTKWLVSNCMTAYFPKKCTQELLAKGMEKLAEKLPHKQYALLKLCEDIFMKRSHATAWELIYLMDRCKGTSYSFTKEQELLVLDHLCIKPAELQFAFRYASGISIKAYSTS